MLASQWTPYQHGKKCMCTVGPILTTIHVHWAYEKNEIRIIRIIWVIRTPSRYKAHKSVWISVVELDMQILVCHGYCTALYNNRTSKNFQDSFTSLQTNYPRPLLAVFLRSSK